MEPSAARLTLLEQHERIRRHLVDCSALARRVRDGEPVQAALDATVEALRRDVADHNLLETAMLRPLLHGSTVWGKLLIDRMLEEHVAEHAVFWELLAGSTAAVVERMDELVDELDAHMAAEERTFLSPQVLRGGRS